jgi:hypothetical protein
MYVTVRRSTHIGGMDEIVRRAREGLLPTITAQPGFVSYNIFSLENNVVMAITIFDNQAAADAVNKPFVVWAREQELRALLTGPHEVLSGEVVVHVTEPSAPFETGGGYG